MVEGKGLSVAVRNKCDNDFKLYSMCQLCVNNVISLYEHSIEQLIMSFYSCYKFSKKEL